MSGPERKTRRRFLADALFLGGGLSAAAFLAGTDLGCDIASDPPPAIAGEMVAPPPPEPPVMGLVAAPRAKPTCD